PIGVGGPLVGLVYVFGKGFSGMQLSNRLHLAPNEGIWRSLKHGIVVGIIVGIIVALIAGLFVGFGLGPFLFGKFRYFSSGFGKGLVSGLDFGLIAGLTVGLLFGLSVVCRNNFPYLDTNFSPHVFI